MKCSLHSRHFTSTQDWFHDRPLLNLYSVIVLVPGTNPQTVIRNRRIESLLSTLLVHMGFTLHCTSSGMEQLVAHPVTTTRLFCIQLTNYSAGNPPDSLNDSAENVAEEGGRGEGCRRRGFDSCCEQCACSSFDNVEATISVIILRLARIRTLYKKHAWTVIVFSHRGILRGE
ncbi:hypothetical protein BLNAU_23439 [Blattamonas nauphoetae]|uniref:Uncharacterized protein n=1 Tax=Blattamonas nauphoetae TaxID=2049346 RepID=A0ABQ9WQ66_9EUKA|nr:hypothetical protein BLNAU_23439 [Blattamonas nauphoetae]